MTALVIDAEDDDVVTELGYSIPVWLSGSVAAT
jgi:hypothetical protein